MTQTKMVLLDIPKLTEDLLYAYFGSDEEELARVLKKARSAIDAMSNPLQMKTKETLFSFIEKKGWSDYQPFIGLREALFY